MAQMTPMLRGELSLFLYNSYLTKVSYLRQLGHDAKISVAQRFAMMVYAPGEDLSNETALFVIKHGICYSQGMVRRLGDIMGEDMILSNPHLRDMSAKRALSYLHVLELKQHHMFFIARHFPSEHRALQWAIVKLGLKKAMLLIRMTLLCHHTLYQRFCKLTTAQRLVICHDILAGQFNTQPGYYLKHGNMASSTNSYSERARRQTQINKLAVDVEDMKQMLEDLCAAKLKDRYEVY